MTGQLNQRLESMKRKYEDALAGMEGYNRRLNEKIACYRKLEELGNFGIAFDEMSCSSVIEKLAHIERSSGVIWATFEHHYSRGFFYPEIEREFGITPETHDKLVEQFYTKVEEYQTLAQ